MGLHRNATLSLAVALLLTACGPSVFTRTRMVYEPYSVSEGRQQKEGVVVELKYAKDVPPQFLVPATACDQYGRPLVDKDGTPVMEQVSLKRPGQYWEQMSLTNHTDHVINMNGVVIRLFDPGANQLEVLSWDDVRAQLSAERPCGSTDTAFQRLKVNKLFDRNMDIPPRTTSTFWVAFRPEALDMPGVWKYAIYEVPVKADAAGRPVKTTQFEMRVVAKQVVDTYTRANALARPSLVESKELGESATPENSAATGRRPSHKEPKLSRASAVTPESTARAQAQLKAQGFDPGSADGGMGPRTRAAIRKFQAARGLPVTGELDQNTLTALGG